MGDCIDFARKKKRKSGQNSNYVIFTYFNETILIKITKIFRPDEIRGNQSIRKFFPSHTTCKRINQNENDLFIIY